jgi:hypothetical protein
VKALESEIEMRSKIYDRLAKPDWDRSLEADAVRMGWTHVLIDVRLEHSSEIPLPVVVRNKYFVLYRFVNSAE